MLVLAALILFAAMIVPSIDTMYGELRLNAAADLVRARWADARSHAIDEGVPYRFEVKPGTGQFRIAQDSDASASGPSPAEEALPDGVTFAATNNSTAGSEASGEWVTMATFLSDSSAKEDVIVRFAARGCRPMILSLRALTGAVHVEYETGASK